MLFGLLSVDSDMCRHRYSGACQALGITTLLDLIFSPFGL